MMKLLFGILGELTKRTGRGTEIDESPLPLKEIMGGAMCAT
jgi:hypothetical protein